MIKNKVRDKQFYILLGNVLKARREYLCYSLQDVSNKMLNKISRQAIQKYENGILELRVDIFNLLCNALQLEPQSVLDEVNKKRKDTHN